MSIYIFIYVIAVVFLGTKSMGHVSLAEKREKKKEKKKGKVKREWRSYEVQVKHELKTLTKQELYTNQ